MKHVRTPPSTVIISPFWEILKVSTHPVCELPVKEESQTAEIDYKYVDQVHKYIGLGKKGFN